MYRIKQYAELFFIETLITKYYFTPLGMKTFNTWKTIDIYGNVSDMTPKTFKDLDKAKDFIKTLKPIFHEV